MFKIFYIPAKPIFYIHTMYLLKKYAKRLNDISELENEDAQEKAYEELKPECLAFIQKWMVLINCYCLLFWLFVIKYTLEFIF